MGPEAGANKDGNARIVFKYGVYIRATKRRPAARSPPQYFTLALKFRIYYLVYVPEPLRLEQAVYSGGVHV